MMLEPNLNIKKHVKHVKPSFFGCSQYIYAFHDPSPFVLLYFMLAPETALRPLEPLHFHHCQVLLKHN